MHLLVIFASLFLICSAQEHLTCLRTEDVLTPAPPSTPRTAHQGVCSYRNYNYMFHSYQMKTLSIFITIIMQSLFAVAAGEEYFQGSSAAKLHDKQDTYFFHHLWQLFLLLINFAPATGIIIACRLTPVACR